MRAAINSKEKLQVYGYEIETLSIRYLITPLNHRDEIDEFDDLFTRKALRTSNNKFGKYFNQTEILIQRQGLVSPGTHFALMHVVDIGVGVRTLLRQYHDGVKNFSHLSLILKNGLFRR